MPGTPVRSTPPLVWLIALMALALVMSACGNSSAHPWHITRGGPTVQILASGSCPQSLGAARDVRNHGAWRLTELVPTSPSSGLICRYSASAIGPATSPAAQPALYRHVRLDRAQAASLARLIAKVSTKAPTGVTACPADFNTATVIAFGYGNGVGANLWYSDTGCQTLDNGSIGASETGNPSFYVSVIPLINRLAPQNPLPPGPAPLVSPLPSPSPSS